MSPNPVVPLAGSALIVPNGVVTAANGPEVAAPMVARRRSELADRRCRVHRLRRTRLLADRLLLRWHQYNRIGSLKAPRIPVANRATSSSPLPQL